MAKNGKMTLWEAVCKTDPSHTKHVGQRGGFTAIDAMYQIQNATEQFGPAGIGWGWDFELIYPPNDTIVAKVTLWHGKPEYTVTQCGQKKLNSTKGPDEDAAKKAVTDGLTKCLSYLGFNADVFLGKFDDNKYVAAMTAEHDPLIKGFNEWIKTAIVELENMATDEGLNSWLKTNKARVDNALLNPDLKAEAMAIMSKYKAVKAEISPPALKKPAEHNDEAPF
jgi:hypothetical protein